MENNLENYLLAVISGREKGILATIIRLILFLLELIYKFLVNIRYFIYKTGIAKSNKLNCKVVSIGNITVGGTGKTPLVRFLAEELNKRGHKVVIVSRGYKGANTNPRVVFDGNKLSIPEEKAGDEALMLSKMLKDVPIVTGKDRYKAGELALKEFSPDMILLDDGFQYWQLARDKDIVLLDATNPFGYKHLLPGGLLREPLKALSRADIFLITKVNGVSKDKISLITKTLKKYNPIAGIHKGKFENRYIKVFQKNGEIKTLSADFLKEKKVIAFSGIGNPSSFQQSLEGCGCNVLLHYRFPDHYQYTSKDIEEIVKKNPTTLAGKATGSAGKRVDMIITTAKDLVRLNREMRAFLITEYNLAVLEIGMNVDKEDEFLNTIESYEKELN